jgi:hypothetical protein
LAQILTSFIVSCIAPNPQNILASLLMSSFHFTCHISNFPIVDHRIVISNHKRVHLYLWCPGRKNQTGQAAIEPRISSLPEKI